MITEKDDDKSVLKSEYMKANEYWKKILICNHEILEKESDVTENITEKSYEKINFDILPFGSDMQKTLFLEKPLLLHIYMMGILSIYQYKVKGTQENGISTPPLKEKNSKTDILIFKNLVEKDESFSNYLNRLKENVLTGYRYQLYPVSELLEKMSKKNQSSIAKFSEILLYTRELHQVESLPILIKKYSINLCLEYSNVKDGMKCSLLYDNGIFSRIEVERIVDCLKIILEQVSLNKAVKLSEIESIGKNEVNALLATYEEKYTDDFLTIHEIFEQRVVEYPDSIAVKYYNQEITYYDLDCQANAFANYLLEQFHVHVGDLIGVVLEKDIHMIVAVLAILKIGAAYVPIAPGYPSDHIGDIIENIECKVILGNHDTYQKISQILWKQGKVEYYHIVDSNNIQLLIKNQREILDNNLDSRIQTTGKAEVDWNRIEKPSVFVTSDQIAYIIHTSGTTGSSKGVLVEHKNVTSLIQSSYDLFDFSQKDIWTMFHSFCFDFSVWEMLCPLLYGAKVIIVDQDTSRNLLKFRKMLIEENVSVLNQTPSAFYQLMEIDGKEDRELDSLRYVIFGGEALKPIKIKDWAKEHPTTKMINMYGITETTVHVTYKELSMEDMSSEVSNIGLPIPTLNVYIMDEYGHLVPDGTPGELYVGGYGVSRGYLKSEELTNRKFINNPYKLTERVYKTGDLVRRHTNGELVYLGRIDQQVKLRGFRIELGYIENKVISHPNICDAVAIVNGDDSEKELLLYYTADITIDSSDIRKYVETKLPEYMVPSTMIQIDTVPLNQNGKVDREQLIKSYGKGNKKSQYIAPRNETEEIMVEIWKTVLDVEQVSIEDDFFEMGGHSLRAIKVEIEMEKANIPVEYADLYKYRTISALSSFIKEKKEDE